MAALGLLAASSAAHADVGELAQGRVAVVHESALVGRYNPVGAGMGTRTSLRWMLFPKDSAARHNKVLNQLLAPSHLGIATMAELTPACLRAGVGLEFMPLALWRMRLSYHATQTLGTFGFMMSFDNPTDDFGVQARQARSHIRGTLVPRLVHRVIGENLLQAKLWRLVLFNLSSVEVFSALDNGYFYSGEYDLLERGRGDVMVRNVAVGAVTLLDGPVFPELAVGAFHAIARSLSTGLQNQQAGMALLVGPPLRTRIPRGLSWIILAGVHVQDAHRTWQPYLVWLAGLAF